MTSPKQTAATALILIVLYGCGPTAPEDEYEKLQQTLQSAEQRLNALGKVERKEYPPGAAWSLDLHGATIDGQVVSDATTIERISELLLSGSTITDEQLQQLLQSNRTVFLNVLDVSNTGITDAGLAGLAHKQYLQKVNIQGSKVTDGFVSTLQSERAADAQIPAQFKSVAVTK